MAISIIQAVNKLKTMKQREKCGNLGFILAALMFVWTTYKSFFPSQIRIFLNMIHRYTYPYVHISFPEYQGDGFYQYKTLAYKAIERYLHKKSSDQARFLKAGHAPDSDTIVLSIEENEEVSDEFQGIKVRWASRQLTPKGQSISLYTRGDEKRYFRLTFYKKHREFVTNVYLKHVLEEGKQIAVRERRRKLYTNRKSDVGNRTPMWSQVRFEHPATFDTLVMEPKKKKEIMDDLINFSKAKEYYAKIGKAWKRGYLLYGPPGTGKSTMIAAMANLLNYDVYDLELTSVKDNSELRKLLIDTSGRSIIVIEDIDCSLDLTGQRDQRNTKTKEDKKDPVEKIIKTKKVEDNNKSSSQVTLSGLLNFIDGLWSACGGERLIVFTTNYVEDLDPALIRRGRMDKHIELSYCRFEAFKDLAKIYLNIESHELFDKVGKLLEEIEMTPADVAENLMPKSTEEDADFCVKRLVNALEQAKEEARLKAEEEERLKAEKEEKKKQKQKQDSPGSEVKGTETVAADQEKENDDHEVKSGETVANEAKENTHSVVDSAETVTDEVKEN
ncbi:OLC1v1004989C1 [Oldenlandia corymbosa var. corymbosa]|uniref:OLC1v1004989C1 n=1 Tax=Oldenlandia corymbosa var. corymbosa TaxID=529605 RepID=A0AAV1DDK0_OLDCO|nr:OLC1v1004989C1 [Oldenlandia corymbosa var. corymbosa]